jgi:four helix bundle protein
MSGERRPYDLEDRLLDYAADIVRITTAFPNTLVGRHIASQLLRSGTSPLSNHGEAEAAESVSDFIHKLKICLKELKESRRWIRLAQRVPLAEEDALSPVLQETEELTRIFAASIRTASNKKASVVREEHGVYEVGSELDVERWTLNVSEEEVCETS